MPRNRSLTIDYSSREAFGDLLLQEWDDRLRYAIPSTSTTNAERREQVLEHFDRYCEIFRSNGNLTMPKDRKHALRLAHDMLDWFARTYDPRLDDGFKDHRIYASFKRFGKRLTGWKEPEVLREDEILGEGSWDDEDSVRQWR